MADYYTQSMRALRLAGKGERTQKCYTRAVRQLSQFYGKVPAEISETELEQSGGQVRCPTSNRADG